MIPLHGVYLMLVLLGTPEQIGLKQVPGGYAACMQELKPYASSGKYSIVSCLVDGAIVSPTIAQKQGQQLLDGLMGGLERSGVLR